MAGNAGIGAMGGIGGMAGNCGSGAIGGTGGIARTAGIGGIGGMLCAIAGAAAAIAITNVTTCLKLISVFLLKVLISRGFAPNPGSSLAGPLRPAPLLAAALCAAPLCRCENGILVSDGMTA
jgi:hypothetical protein